MNAHTSDVQSLNINLGGIKLAVNGDMNRIISFNPDDLAFAEAFYGLISFVENKEAEYNQRAAELDANTDKDTYGIAKNTPEALALLKEICTDIRAGIDKIFGAGTSDTVFGTVNTLDMFEQFFNGITPFIKQARAKKTKKYTGEKAKGVMK